MKVHDGDDEAVIGSELIDEREGESVKTIPVDVVASIVPRPA